ncbi:MAG: hypothetical protein DRP79_06000 [Planctomycetota bacterium]|nr:MAG: hypothetical protein DRP79_06000 [Planctomycetota bacterium]
MIDDLRIKTCRCSFISSALAPFVRSGRDRIARRLLSPPAARREAELVGTSLIFGRFQLNLCGLLGRRKARKQPAHILTQVD